MAEQRCGMLDAALTSLADKPSDHPGPRAPERVQLGDVTRGKRDVDANLRREVTGLCAINEDLSNRIAQYAAEEAKRLAPLQAANRKRREEAQARKGK